MGTIFSQAVGCVRLLTDNDVVAVYALRRSLRVMPETPEGMNPIIGFDPNAIRSKLRRAFRRQKYPRLLTRNLREENEHVVRDYATDDIPSPEDSVPGDGSQQVIESQKTIVIHRMWLASKSRPSLPPPRPPRKAPPTPKK